MQKAWKAVVVVLVGVVLVGCGGGDDAGRPARVPAEVKVIYQGAPVEGAHVSLNPTTPDGKTAFGTTDADGVAKLSTFGGDDGAVPGEYQVSLRKTKTEGPAAPVDPNNIGAMPANPEALKPAESTDLLPTKYGSVTTSGLTASVTEGGNNTFEFTLTD